MEHHGDRGRLMELVFLDRVPRPLWGPIVVVEAVGSGLLGVVLTRLHHQLVGQLAAGMALNPLQTLIATGSSARTAWPGWVAAACFLVALLRLRRGAAEPPPSRTTVDQLTPTQLRSGLRREYFVVRFALVLVFLLAAVDIGRAAATLIAATGGEPITAGTAIATAVEAAGYVTAAVVLAIWARTFGAEVRRLGAL